MEAAHPGPGSGAPGDTGLACLRDAPGTHLPWSWGTSLTLMSQVLNPLTVGTSCSLYLDCWLQTGACLVLSYKLRLVSKVTSPEKSPQETRAEMLPLPAPTLSQSLSVILVDFLPPISLITF